MRVAPDVLEIYKTMGDGYTSIMADVLKYAINNPDILTSATK
ncbi:MAG: BrnA antitoxin family protein [Treponema sp.]|nr:BrnA antitoxin family protein [Treponema sp.]